MLLSDNEHTVPQSLFPAQAEETSEFTVERLVRHVRVAFLDFAGEVIDAFFDSYGSALYSCSHLLEEATTLF